MIDGELTMFITEAIACKTKYGIETLEYKKEYNCESDNFLTKKIK